MKNHLRVVWGSFALLVAAFIFLPMAAAAPTFKAQASNGRAMSLKLLETRCSDPAVLKHLLAQVRPDLLDKFKDARLHYDGKDWASCWLALDGVVFSLDEEGAPLQPIPMDAFRDDSV